MPQIRPSVRQQRRRSAVIHPLVPSVAIKDARCDTAMCRRCRALCMYASASWLRLDAAESRSRLNVAVSWLRPDACREYHHGGSSLGCADPGLCFPTRNKLRCSSVHWAKAGLRFPTQSKLDSSSVRRAEAWLRLHEHVQKIGLDVREALHAQSTRVVGPSTRWRAVAHRRKAARTRHDAWRSSTRRRRGSPVRQQMHHIRPHLAPAPAQAISQPTTQNHRERKTSV
eukprot:366252-Chlamydomonas_euryale.AAC.6